MVENIRDPNRLDKFYEDFKNVHKEKFPDLRFGQFVVNFNHWLTYEKEIDIFYVEDDEMEKLIKEFGDAITVLYLGIDT
jgi:hypothetical protein